MITEVARIVGISDSNPVQFWAADKPTFNDRQIALIDQKKYTQNFTLRDPLRLDVLFNTKRYDNWDSTVTYAIGDVVYDSLTNTRWRSNSNGNLNHEPNPVNTGTHPSAFWDHDSLPDITVAFYDNTVTYEPGDRVLAYHGAGTSALLYECIAETTGNQPNGNVGVYWDIVTEANGRFQLLLVNEDIPEETVDFGNIISTSKHQFIQLLFSSYPQFTDRLLYLAIYDVQQDTILAYSDCFLLSEFVDPSVLIICTNSVDFDGLNFEASNASFYLRLLAHFYEEDNPVDEEDHKLSNGVLTSLKSEMQNKRLLNIIEYLPDHMHKKVRKMLMCDQLSIRIDMEDLTIIEELYWKCKDTYNKTRLETSTVCRAQVLLTQADGILTNVSKGDQFAGTKISSEEFSEEFG